MKKEIPRLLKSASIVYAFDCFGTVFSSTSVFYKKIKVLFNPSKLDIRWVMIIPDSFWSYIKALWLCIINGIYPTQIIRCPKWKIKRNNFETVVECLIDIVSTGNHIRYVDSKKIKKVVYINNDLRVDDYVNANIDRCKSDVIAMNVMDFWQNKFSHLV